MMKIKFDLLSGDVPSGYDSMPVLVSLQYKTNNTNAIDTATMSVPVGSLSDSQFIIKSSFRSSFFQIDSVTIDDAFGADGYEIEFWVA